MKRRFIILILVLLLVLISSIYIISRTPELPDYFPREVGSPIIIEKEMSIGVWEEFPFSDDLILRLKLLEVNQDNLTFEKDIKYKEEYPEKIILQRNDNLLTSFFQRLKKWTFHLDSYSVEPISTIKFENEIEIFDLRSYESGEMYGKPIKSVPSTTGIIYLNFSKDGKNTKTRSTLCLNNKQATDLKARGDIKILFVPLYLDGVHYLVSNHENIGKEIYKPSFQDINYYLEFKGKEFTGGDIINLNFVVSEPLEISLDELDTGLIKNRPELIQFIIQILEVNNSLEIEDYDLLAFRVYDSDEHREVMLSRGIEINDYIFNPDRNFASHLDTTAALFVNGGLENISETDEIIRYKRNVYTKIMLHEILHLFGASEIMYQADNLYFIGNVFSGQELIDISSHSKYKSVSDIQRDSIIIGEFQNIDYSVAKEIGWTDSNENGILDVHEFCVN